MRARLYRKVMKIVSCKTIDIVLIYYKLHKVEYEYKTCTELE